MIELTISAIPIMKKGVTPMECQKTITLLLLLPLLAAGGISQTFNPPATHAINFGSSPDVIDHADIDGDGDEDIIVADSSLMTVFLNDGLGGFLPQPPIFVPGGVIDLAAGDVDGDGDADIVVNGATVMATYRNDGAGGLTRTDTLFSGPGRIVLRDIDGDGDLDAFVGEAGASEVLCYRYITSLLSSGYGVFAPLSLVLPFGFSLDAFTVEDIDKDGAVEVIGTATGGAFSGSRIRIWEYVPSVAMFGATDSFVFDAGVAVAVGDFVGNDQRMEIAICVNNVPELRVYSVSSTSTANLFVTIPLSGSVGPISPVVGDFDGDAVDEIFVVNDQANQVLGFSQIGPNHQTTILATLGGGAAALTAADFDRDGQPDLAGVRAGPDDIIVWLREEAPDFRKPMLTEVNWGEPDWIEVTNFDEASVDLTGWKLSVETLLGGVLASTPLSGSLAPGESLVAVEAGSQLAVLNGVTVQATLPQMNFSSAQSFRVTLESPGGRAVDEVRAVSGLGGLPAFAPSGGGAFRGIINLTGQPTGSGSLERIWGLDSNAAADWTIQSVSSPGLESRSSGPRGSDPIPRETVLINEVDDSPDLIELVNTSNGPVDLQGWFLLCSPTQGVAHAIIRPWPGPTIIPAGAYFVVGESAAPPAEMPSGVRYDQADANIPWTTRAFDCALYDDKGRLVDLMRVVGDDDEQVHNHPRAPSSWDAFTGAAPREAQTGSNAIGRVNLQDTDTGADWRAVFTRTMGAPNFANSFAGSPGLGQSFDYRINAGAPGGGFFIIVNAGPQSAGYRQSILTSYTRTFGRGPILGLGSDALANWATLNTLEPWGGNLDAEGSWRYDFPTGTIPPGFTTDLIAILQDPTGQIVAQTKVIFYDS